MDGGGERRRVGKVQSVEGFEGRTQGNAGNGDVHHLVHRAGAQHLDAQQLVGVPIRQKLGDEERRAGIVVGLVVGDSHDSLHVVAGLLGGGFRQAGAAHVQAGQLHHAGAQHAGVRLVFPVEVLGQSAALQVGGGAHGGVLCLAGEAVLHQSAVPGGVDVRHAGGETFVHHNGALFHLDASALQKGGVGPDARGHHHSAAGQQAGVCLYALHLAIAHKGRGLGAGEHPDTLLLQVALDVAGHLPIQHAGEDLGGHFHHGDGNAPVKEVLRQLQADEAAADDHGLLHAVGLQVVPHGDGVLGGPHGEHAV